MRGIALKKTFHVGYYEDTLPALLDEKDGNPRLDWDRPPAPDPDCKPVVGANVVPIRIRFRDAMTTMFMLEKVDFRLDDRTLADPVTLGEAAKTGAWVTLNLSTTPGCHRLRANLHYRGNGTEYVESYRFHVRSSLVFDATPGITVDVIGYEHGSAPLEERPVLRMMAVRPPRTAQ